MTINVLFIVAVGIIIGCTVISFQKGLIKSILSFGVCIVALALAQWLNPYVTDFIMEQTPLYGTVKEQCMQIYTPQNQEGIKTTGTDEEIIQSYPIAERLKKQMIENNNDIMYEILNVNAIEEYIAGYIAKSVISAAAYVLTSVLVFILLRIAIVALDVITHLPVLKEMNKTAGAVFGFLQGMLLVWLMLLTIGIFRTTSWGMVLQGQINENIFLNEAIL